MKILFFVLFALPGLVLANGPLIDYKSEAPGTPGALFVSVDTVGNVLIEFPPHFKRAGKYAMTVSADEVGEIRSLGEQFKDYVAGASNPSSVQDFGIVTFNCYGDDGVVSLTWDSADPTVNGDLRSELQEMLAELISDDRLQEVGK